MNHARNSANQLQYENESSNYDKKSEILTSTEKAIEQDFRDDINSYNEGIFSPHCSRKNTMPNMISTVSELCLPNVEQKASSCDAEEEPIYIEQLSAILTDASDSITMPPDDESEIDIKSNYVVKYLPNDKDNDISPGNKPNIDKTVPAATTTERDEPNDRNYVNAHSTKTGNYDNISSLSASSDGDRSKDDTPCCRICHSGSSAGQLLSPCYCKGTQGQVHIKCLEHWLSCTGRTKCELCGFQFEFTEESKSFMDFILCPGNRYVKNLLFCDILCFILVTPLSLASVSLVIATAALLNWKVSVEVIGLVLFAIFVIFLYLFWLITALRFQKKMWKHWKFRNRVIRIKPVKHKAQNSSTSRKTLRNVRNNTEEVNRYALDSHQLPDSSNVQIWSSNNSQILVIPREPLES
ncbi:E3 ubiquitin-protein ligase MARCH3-like [Argonauta hians]